MKNFIRTAVCAVALAGLLVAPVAQVSAQDMTSKPVVVATFPPIDELIGDIEFLTAQAGTPDVARMVPFMLAPFTAGIDKSKPLGIVVMTDGTEFSPLGFVPVSDIKKTFIALEEQLGEATDIGDGIYSLEDGPAPVFVKESGGWAFVAQTAEQLKELPQDPTTLLDGLDKDYDIGIRANVQNIPEMFRNIAITQLKAGAETGMERLPEEEDAEYEARVKLVKMQIDNFVRMINETDQLTFGLMVDSMAKATYMDVSLTAMPGTRLARQMATLAETTTDFAGVLLPEAAVTFSFSGKVAEEDIAQFKDTMNVMRASAIREIENDEDLPNDEARQAAKEVVGDLLDILQATVESGKMDGGAALLLNDKEFTLVGGGYVADGAAFDATFKKIVELAKQEPEFPGVNMNAAQHNGVSIHTMTIPVPEDEDEAREVLGEKLEAALGIGAKSIWISVGANNIDVLKQAIDKSAADAGKAVPPGQFVLSLAPIMKFAASMDPNPMVAALAESLGNAEGKDHVSIRVKPMERGAIYRLEVEEGVMKAVGEAAKAAGAGPGGGAPPIPF